ncbi:MAG: PEP-CTERM sorting domain-containing protein [Acidobacteriaceae bacterium]|nr:PEP-CTERM sorting domain-containing protein [Acidobacteriaceae bacterium]
MTAVGTFFADWGTTIVAAPGVGSPTPVREPTSLALFGIGALGGLIVLRRHRHT